MPDSCWSDIFEDIFLPQEVTENWMRIDKPFELRGSNFLLWPQYPANDLETISNILSERPETRGAILFYMRKLKD
jgi:hypothetical protein